MLRIIQLIASNPVRMLSVSLWLTPAAIVMYRYAHNSRLEAQDFFYCALIYLFGGCMFVLSWQLEIYLKECTGMTQLDSKQEVL